MNGVEGASKKPVYLFINDDKAELRKADHLWGKTVLEATDIPNGETSPEARVACIGLPVKTWFSSPES